MGNKIAATIAPKETYFQIRNTSKKQPKQIKAVSGLTAIIIPSELATPLPPLKFAKTGNTCPMIAKNDAVNCKIKTSSLIPRYILDKSNGNEAAR